MSTFNVIVDIGSCKETKKLFFVKRILLEIFDFIEAEKSLSQDIVGPPV